MCFREGLALMNRKDWATSVALKLMGEHAVLWGDRVPSVQGSGYSLCPLDLGFPRHMEVVG